MPFSKAVELTRISGVYAFTSGNKLIRYVPENTPLVPTRTPELVFATADSRTDSMITHPSGKRYGDFPQEQRALYRGKQRNRQREARHVGVCAVHQYHVRMVCKGRDNRQGGGIVNAYHRRLILDFYESDKLESVDIFYFDIISISFLLYTNDDCHNKHWTHTDNTNICRAKDCHIRILRFSKISEYGKCIGCTMHQ